MSSVVFGDPAGTLNEQFVELEANRITIAPYDQSYQSFSSAPGIERAAQQGVVKKVVSDLSGGLLIAPDVRDFEDDYNRFFLNRGIQTRIPGLAILPFEITNQSSVTNEENISGGVAANWRCHGLNTAVGGTQRYLVGIGNRVYRNNTSTGALEVAAGNINGAGSASSMGAVVTAIAELKVNGSLVVAVALKGANDILYTTNPGASPIVWTTLVNTAAGDYINAMNFLSTLGPGVNVVQGEVGGVNGVWYALGSEAAPWTLKPLVLADSKDEPGSLATTTSGPEYPTWSSNDETAQVNSSSTPGALIWGNPDDIIGDATSDYALFEPRTDNAINDKTGYLYAGGFDFTDIPLDAVIVGIKLEIEKQETNAGCNINDTDISLLVDGARKGIGRPEWSEWPTSKAYSVYGGLTDLWGTTWTGADMQTLTVRMQAGFLYEIPDAALPVNAAGRISQVRLTVVWRMAGGSVSFSTGGYQLAPNPVFPNRMTVAVPTADETDTVILPRSLYHLDFAWDPATNRPVFDFSQPNTGMLNVHAASASQGGYLAAGDNVVGPGTFAKHVDVEGQLRSYEFPAYHDSKGQRINTVFQQGAWAIHEVVASDYSERQWWFSREDVYYLDTLQQSLSGLSIAAQPIPWAEAVTNLAQRVIYSIFPNGTNTAVARQHLPSNLSLDPRLIDTDKTKAVTSVGGAVYVESPKFALGPTEALQTILVLSFQGEDVSDDDTVQIQLAVDGASFGDSALDHTFTEAFEEYNVPEAGVAVHYLQYRLGLDHVLSTGTPNALPFMFTTEQEWVKELRYLVFCNDFSKSGNLFETVAALEVVQGQRSVQPLYLTPFPDTQRSIPATFEGIVMPDGGIPMSPDGNAAGEIPAVLTRYVTRNRETVEEPLEIGFIFRTVPGIGT